MPDIASMGTSELRTFLRAEDPINSLVKLMVDVATKMPRPDKAFLAGLTTAVSELANDKGHTKDSNRCTCKAIPG